MNKFQKYAVAGFSIVLMGIGIVHTFASDEKNSATPAAASTAPPAKAENTVVEKTWSVRCPNNTKGSDKKDCEAFDRLEIKSSSARVVEFAVGFPQDNSLKAGMARGVIILPLGILLQSGASMKVDDGKPLAFSSRFCNTSGCFSFVNLDKDILNSMKKGKTLNIFFKTFNNQDAKLPMTLSGFEKALKNIE